MHSPAFTRDLRGDYAAVVCIALTPCESLLLEPVDKPRNVRITCRRQLGDQAQRHTIGSGVVEDSKHLILLRRNSRGSGHGTELVNQLSRQVLKEEIDLALCRIFRV